MRDSMKIFNISYHLYYIASKINVIIRRGAGGPSLTTLSKTQSSLQVLPKCGESLHIGCQCGILLIQYAVILYIRHFEGDYIRKVSTSYIYVCMMCVCMCMCCED